MSQILAMSDKIREYEETIAALKTASSTQPTPMAQGETLSTQPATYESSIHQSGGLHSLSEAAHSVMLAPPGQSPMRSRHDISDISLDEHGKVRIALLDIRDCC
jgi:hypothetical protein